MTEPALLFSPCKSAVPAHGGVLLKPKNKEPPISLVGGYQLSGTTTLAVTGYLRKLQLFQL